MNDRLKELAEQAGIIKDFTVIGMWLADDGELERFAELVRQDERERVGLFDTEENDDWLVGQDDICKVAKTIRARG